MKSLITIAMASLVMLVGCNSGKAMQESQSLQKIFLTQQYSEVRTIVEAMKHDGRHDPYVYDLYCNSLRELGASLDLDNRIRIGLPELKSYVIASCDLAFGKLESARERFSKLLVDDRTNSYAYHGLLEYAAATGKPAYLEEVLASIRNLPKTPDFLIASERYHSLQLLSFQGDFDQLEKKIKVLGPGDLEEMGYPNFLVGPRVRQNALAEIRRYVDNGISVLGRAQHLYALRADLIYLLIFP